MTKKYSQELVQGYTMSTVMEEAQRCLLCHDAPCSNACPAGTDPAKFIRSVRFRNFKGAAETIRSNNALGAACARICPTERYCEQGCSRCGIDKPINIGGIQRFVTDFEEQCGMKVLERGPANGKKIGIIGSGPAGLQAAATLLQLGYEVDIYEKGAKAGGFLRTGIPEYRLPDAVVDTEVARIAELGANFLYCREVGKDVSMEELKEKYDAVLVAVGIGRPQMLEMFEGNPYAVPAVTFLAEVDERQGEVELPDNALVIGGGDAAMDVSATLKLLGVQNVTTVTRKELSDFRASKVELETARAQGVTIVDGYAPVAVEGKVVTFRHRRLNSELKIEADKIILAVGQSTDADQLGLPIVKNEVDFDGFQADGKVFVAGDIAKGDKTAVWAVRKGKAAAYAIHNFVGGR
ncbi:FAD-dependent oxidoreductase [Dysosmobacter sp. NSJ-60]|uniref:dihydrouracil dehydrogenase (NAD(+)) n=1 Tax=Pusillibacter faecalis TaxID=2714358 RepID=A0A810QGZ6_9FIRM|nr:FAD-dependent oxidoreductase [Pusillibacter faecalis]MBC5746548.1 FAD-dependent oxidoreductase [Dysosmobacter hominis]MBS5657412.1 FAD-dependent oxidoreductase [Oscillibacter sp.]MCQ5025500.1 FAD-dependent oxidoreductase [Oscillibacter valericigenes]BCK83733.1 dihydropyrimidine dehydrogenase subunit A [Pusillibacter faecalis]